MSFFPGASTPLPSDPALTPGALSDQDDWATLRSHTPFTSVASEHDDWVLLSNSDGPDFSSLHYMPWPTEEPRGLGVSTLPSTFDRSHCNPGASVVHPSVSFSDCSWPSEITASHLSGVQAHTIRKDSCQESCNPLSTLLPGTMWDNLQPSEPSTSAYDTSPGRSDYSASSRPSAMSSPYTHSEGYVQNAPSPFVKIEEPRDSATPQYHFTNNGTPLEQSLLVNPSDLLTVPIEERVKTRLSSPSYSDVEDCKPYVDSPNTQRAYSSEGTSDDILEVRKKRTYTKPENALCCCHICGKPFQRSYNLRAHMETHDPDRDQPNECPYEDCGKRFVRRTDLTRHQQSVHEKRRDFVCPLCDASFARKDTLRRHVEDGCSRRANVKSHTSRSARRQSNGCITKPDSFYDYRDRTIAQHKARVASTKAMALRNAQTRS